MLSFSGILADSALLIVDRLPGFPLQIPPALPTTIDGQNVQIIR